MYHSVKMRYLFFLTAAMAQWVRAWASQAEGWVFHSQSRQTQAGDDSSTAKRSAIGPQK